MLIITVKIFPCVSKFFPVSEQNSLCFTCLEKVRTKFPVFPVPWPPCKWFIYEKIRIYVRYEMATVGI